MYLLDFRDSHKLELIFLDLHGFAEVWGLKVWRPVPPESCPLTRKSFGPGGRVQLIPIVFIGFGTECLAACAAGVLPLNQEMPWSWRLGFSDFLGFGD